MVEVGTARAARGEKAFGFLPVGTLADGSPIEIPVVVLSGAEDGPRLFVQSVVHGSEINPLEAMRRVVTELDPSRLRGTLIAVLIANVIAFQHRERRTVFDGEDMNRVWPGRADGRLSERMAFAIYEHAVKGCDAVVDLHTGYSTMLTHVVYGEGDAGSEELARVFGTEYLLMEERDEEWEEMRFAGKLRNVAAADGLPAITPELGGAARFEEERIASGVTGVRNVLVHYGMIEGQLQRPSRQIIIRNHLTRVLADHGGVFTPSVRLGDELAAGQTIGIIYSARDFRVLQEVRSPAEAVLLSYAENPVVHTGDAVAMLGKRGEEYREAAT